MSRSIDLLAVRGEDAERVLGDVAPTSAAGPWRIADIWGHAAANECIEAVLQRAEVAFSLRFQDDAGLLWLRLANGPQVGLDLFGLAGQYPEIAAMLGLTGLDDQLAQAVADWVGRYHVRPAPMEVRAALEVADPADLLGPALALLGVPSTEAA